MLTGSVVGGIVMDAFGGVVMYRASAAMVTVAALIYASLAKWGGGAPPRVPA